jgi:hypothetical protein
MHEKKGDYFVAEILSSLEPRTTIGYIKCEDKSVPQLINISLEEAQSDKKNLGGPLSLNMHDAAYHSLLS